MISYFTFYRPFFMAQLLIAEALFTFRLRKKKLFWLRYAAAVSVCFLLAVFVPVTPNNAIQLSLVFLAMFVITFIANMFCFDVGFSGLLFSLVGAYIVQHCAYCLSNCALLLSNINSNIYGVYTQEVMSYHIPINETAGFFLTFVLYYLIYYLFFIVFGYKIKGNETPKLKKPSLYVISVFGMVISVLVNAIVVYGTTNGDLIMIFNVYNAACCVFLVYVMFNMLNKTTMEKELDTVHEMLQKFGEQYEISKKTIELINIKSHDLKQQIRTIGEKKFINEETIGEISDAVALYDSDIKTGNTPLDIILTEKSLYCYKHNITLTCIADGKLLDFIKEAEIYSLFGNALDNAISAVMRLDDKEKRCIGLSVGKIGGFIAVNVNNYCDGKLRFGDDGMPLTTKRDEDNHGYGLKSIKFIVEHYGGTMAVEAEGEVFNLNIMFPLLGQRVAFEEKACFRKAETIVKN